MGGGVVPVEPAVLLCTRYQAILSEKIDPSFVLGSIFSLKANKPIIRDTFF